MMPVLSVIFCIIAYLSIGHLLLGWFSLNNRGIANSFLAGSGVVSLSTFFLALLFRENLRLISLLLLTAGNLYFCYLLFCNIRKIKSVRSLLINFLPVGLLFLLLLPIMTGSYNLKAWGDELSTWVTPVRMIFYNDLALGLVKHATYGNYPPLWPLVNVNAMSLLGVMHEGVGRMITVAFILFGSVFVFEELSKRWNIPTAKSFICAVIWLGLTCASLFQFTASRYSDPSFSIFMMAAFYYTIIAFCISDSIDFTQLGMGSLFLTVAVGWRPDGILFLPLFAVVAVFFLILNKSQSRQRKVWPFFLITLPAVVLFLLWRLYLLFCCNITPSPGSTSFSTVIFFPNSILKLIFPAVSANIASLTSREIIFIVPQYIALLFCIPIMLILRRNFIKSQNRILKLLLLFPIYNALVGLSLMVGYFSNNRIVVPVRYLMHSIPASYLILVILLGRLHQSKNIPITISRIASVIILSLALLTSMTLGGLYSHLSNDINDYIEYLSKTTKSKFLDRPNVMFIAQQCTLGIDLRWYYYRILEPFYSKCPYSIGKSEGVDMSTVYRDTSIQTNKQFINFLSDNDIQLIVVYESDNEFNRLSGLNLRGDTVYWLGSNQDQKGLSILWSEKRPPFNHRGTHWFGNAAKALWKDIKVWEKEKQSLPDAI